MTTTPDPTTDVAVRDTAPAAPAGARSSELVLWAYEAQQAHQIATSLAKTSFVPPSLRGKPADITAAILAGQELGLRPMASLRSMDIIQGTPALRAHAMRGLVQSHGHRVWLAEQTPERVVMRGQRRESGGFGNIAQYGPEQESVWTIERAQELGLTGKSEWKKQPQTMLTARATGEICRLIAADVLYAMPYATEELHDDPAPYAGEPGTGRVTAAEIMGGAEPAGPHPAEAGEPEPAPAEAAPDDKASRRRLNHLFALFGECDWGDRDDRLQACTVLIGRDITSSNDLTEAEASRLIEILIPIAKGPNPPAHLGELVNNAIAGADQ